MSPQSQVLLVEGKDDKHVIYALAAHYELAQNFIVKDAGGVEALMKILPVQIKGSAVDRVGIVLDADLNLDERWQAVRKLAMNSGYTRLPDKIEQGGLIHEHTGLPKFGVWIMPDNQLPGTLEHFIAFLIPTADSLYELAKNTVENIPHEKRLFPSYHSQKANIHTWLAWQRDPGTPLGLAITKRFLDASLPEAHVLATWLRELFG